jgi:hypothetical protein
MFVCIVNYKEDYDHLKLACKPIFQKINTIYEKESIEVEGKHFYLDILMGGDMKCLQLVLLTIKLNYLHDLNIMLQCLLHLITYSIEITPNLHV